MISAPKGALAQLVAYAVGGGLMTALHAATYWILAQLMGIEPYFANTIGAILSGCAGFLLHSKWTFADGKAAMGLGQAALRYAIVSLAIFALNSFWVWLFVKQLEGSVELSIVPMVFVTPWLGFVLNRYWAFRRR